VLVGWILKSQKMRQHVNASGGLRLWPLWDVAVRFVTPFILLIVLGSALYQEFQGAYEGYSVHALLFFGGGTLLSSRVLSFVLSHFPWRPEKLERVHEPDDEQLLT
jgi:NSS family neurotransmitter:Na+ symporter